jgi:plasmid stabilization system protein ParE
MEFKVEVTEIAAAEIDFAYQWIKERAPDAAERWYDGLMAALSGLRQNPRRCARVPSTSFVGAEVRQLVYGRRRGRYRVLFTIHGNEVQSYGCFTEPERAFAADRRPGHYYS